MTDEPRIAAVIFDLYETLVTEFDPQWRAPPSIGARLGIDDAEFRAAFAALRERRLSGDIPDFASALLEICAPHGIRPRDEILGELLAERMRAKARPFASVDPAVESMLRGLRERGVRLGVLTNAATEEVSAWSRCRLAPLIDLFMTSYEERLLKPDPELYERACRQLRVDPAVTAYVGDGGSDELRGALVAGLTPYWATWFLDRWPAWRVPPEHAERFPRLRAPLDVLAVLP